MAWSVTSINLPKAGKDSRSPRLVARVVEHPAEKAGIFRRVRMSLTAAANRVAASARSRAGGPRNESWQEEAWALYDQVGELHYSANVQAAAVGALQLLPGRIDQAGDTVDLDNLQDAELTQLDRLVIDTMAALGGDSPTGIADLQRGLALHLFIAGEGYLLGLPPVEHDEDGRRLPWRSPTEDGRSPYLLTELEWGVYSVQEAKLSQGDVYKLHGYEYPAHLVKAILVKRPHPLNCAFSDSPVRAAMPILRELVGLTMHISATIDSRLAGAGALFVPQSAAAQGVAPPEEGEEPLDLVDSFIEAAVTSIRDRDAASAMVPVVVTVPDDCGFTPFHLSFATPFDASAKELRDEAIRRLALSLDQPPEVLLGLGTSSHWNAWAIQDDYVRLHITPTGRLIAEEILRWYLRPALLEVGVSEEDVLPYVLAVSADQLVERPNRTPEALQLHERGVIDDETLRGAAGYNNDNAPETKEVDEAVEAALDMVRAAPSLAQIPGLPQLVADLRAVLSGQDANTNPELSRDSQVAEEEAQPAPEEDTEPPAQGPPDQEGETPDAA